MTHSRRAVLAACGAGLPTLAGCSRFDTSGDTPSYDTARLVALGQEEVPRPPTRFPVSVQDVMVSRHRDRARTLVERVPKQPDIPNGAVVERLGQDRNAVLELAGILDDEEADALREAVEERRERRRGDLEEIAEEMEEA